MALSKAERDEALDKLEKTFLAYIDGEQARLTTEYNFLQAVKEAHGIEGSSGRRSKELDKIKALVTVKELLPSVTA